MARGVGIHDFWDLTYEEMVDILKAGDLQQKRELKARASMDYILADLISVGTAKVLGGDVEFPTMYEAYEHLFTDEFKAQKEKQIKKEQERYKAQWMAFAAHVNSQRGK